ncbi:MAG TPA: RtcB family protein, partial [Polyangium sp.]|nr:RtcB family protein [Polyangium sp.]
MTASIVEFLPDRNKNGNKNAELRCAVERLAKTDDVVRIALMPDAHVAEDVCVGTVTATTQRLLPAAVGGDIGCGMVAVQIRSDADLLADRDRAAMVLAGLYTHIPHALHASKNAPELPEVLRDVPLAGGALE